MASCAGRVGQAAMGVRPERGGGGAVTPPGREATRTLRGVECRDQPRLHKGSPGPVEDRVSGPGP